MYIVWGSGFRVGPFGNVRVFGLKNSWSKNLRLQNGFKTVRRGFVVRKNLGYPQTLNS